MLHVYVCVPTRAELFNKQCLSFEIAMFLWTPSVSLMIDTNSLATNESLISLIKISPRKVDSKKGQNFLFQQRFFYCFSPWRQPSPATTTPTTTNTSNNNNTITPFFGSSKFIVPNFELVLLLLNYAVNNQGLWKQVGHLSMPIRIHLVTR